MTLTLDHRQAVAIRTMALRGLPLQPLGENGKFALRRRAPTQGGGLVCCRHFPGGETNFAQIRHAVIWWTNDWRDATKVGA